MLIRAGAACLCRARVLLLFLALFVTGCGEDEPELWVSAQSLTFNYVLRSAQFVIMNVGGGTMEGQIDSTVVEIPTPRFALQAGEDQVVTVTLKPELPQTAYGSLEGQVLVSAGIAGHATIRISIDSLAPDEAPPPAVETDPVWHRAAEGFNSKKGAFIEVLRPPFDSHEITHATAPLAELANSRYTITEAINGAFIGVPELDPPTWTGGEDTDLVTYQIDVPRTGDWYIWVRASAPSQGDNSYYWAFDIDDAAAASADNETMNILDLYESIPDRWTVAWLWYPFVSRTGPFEGQESTQWGPDRAGLHLTAGRHTLTLTPRERAYFDHFWGTMDQERDPNVEPPSLPEK